MKKVVVVLGPTAIGKTKIGIALAKHFRGEIISGDSISVYKGANIGAAKPSLAEQQEVKHHLIDIIEPNEQYSVFRFQVEARALIEAIDKPFIVGGTGLYIKACICCYEFIEKRNESFEEKYANYTNRELYDLLVKLDPKTASINHPNNRKRVLRGIYGALSGDVLSSKTKKNEKVYDYYIVYLNTDRKTLYDRINARVDAMMEEGLLAEVTNLYNKGIRLNAIGYKEFEDYFTGNKTLTEVVEAIKQNSRHLAKKQITWFNNQMDCHFYEVDTNNIDSIIPTIIADVQKFYEEE